MKAINKVILVLVMSILSGVGVSFAALETTSDQGNKKVEIRVKTGEKDSAGDQADSVNIASGMANHQGWKLLDKEREFNTWHLNYTVRVTENKPYGKTIFQQNLSTLGTAPAAFFKRELTPFISKAEVVEGKQPTLFKDMYSDTTKATIDTRMIGGELLSALEVEFSVNDPVFKKYSTKIDNKQVLIDVPDSPETERIIISKTFSFKMEDIDKKPITISISESPKMIVELVIARS